MNATPPSTAWAALSDASFRTIWIAGVVMGTGSVVQDVTSGWIMTHLTTSALHVSLLQTAVSSPVVLLALPAGAMADIVNRRRLMVTLLLALATLAALLGWFTTSKSLTPELLLGFVFLMGCVNAMFTPAWMRTVPDLLAGPLIPLGVTLNSTGINIARLAGATVAGILLASQAAGAGFFLASLAFLVPAAALYRWSGPPVRSTLPQESFTAALAGGISYALNSPGIRAIVIRTLVFSFFGSAIPSLLPVVASRNLHLDGLWFGLLSASFGGGALIGATCMLPIRRKLSIDTILLIMISILAVTAVAMARLESFLLLASVLAVAGGAWVIVVASFGIATGSAAPFWVLSRMLSLYMLTFQGGAALGSLAWGFLAQEAGLPTSLQIAAAGLVLGLPARLWLPMPPANPSLLVPSQHWPVPPLVESTGASDGPVLVTVHYQIDVSDAEAFVTAMREVRLERLR
ncbi:MAG: MFS transporter, partial [Bryobacteraceae bacterium]|nr:MFS transporter [Bryobacteraceae bacterium]